MFYRSREEFDGRFEWSPGSNVSWANRGTWEVETYLSHAGDKFVRVFDANSYLLLSKAMDLMDLGDGWDHRTQWADGARRIGSKGCRAVLVGVKQDALIPSSELRVLSETINSLGDETQTGKCRASFIELESELGHDAFLVPKAVPSLQAITREFLESDLKEKLREEAVLVGGPSC